MNKFKNLLEIVNQLFFLIIYKIVNYFKSKKIFNIIFDNSQLKNKKINFSFNNFFSCLSSS